MKPRYTMIVLTAALVGLAGCESGCGTEMIGNPDWYPPIEIKPDPHAPNAYSLVKGTVTSTSGAPLEGATVWLGYPSDGSLGCSTRFGFAPQGARTDTAGHYRVRYWCYLAAPARDACRVPVTCSYGADSLLARIDTTVAMPNPETGCDSSVVDFRLEVASGSLSGDGL